MKGGGGFFKYSSLSTLTKCDLPTQDTLTGGTETDVSTFFDLSFHHKSGSSWDSFVLGLGGRGRTIPVHCTTVFCRFLSRSFHVCVPPIKRKRNGLYYFLSLPEVLKNK